MPAYASTFLATMVALSVAVERIVEILKQTLGSLPVFRLLFMPRATPAAENLRCACVHLLSATIGGLVAGFSGIDILPTPHHNRYLSYAVAGLLSSGGSAFWNHALDIIQATKVQKEETAKAMTARAALLRANVAAATGGMPIAE